MLIGEVFTRKSLYFDSSYLTKPSQAWEKPQTTPSRREY